jgi:hypothetical protein
LNYIYYDPKTKQVEAVFDTPFLSAQSGWEGKELIRAIVPPGINLPSLDYKIDHVTTQDVFRLWNGIPYQHIQAPAQAVRKKNRKTVLN